MRLLCSAQERFEACAIAGVLAAFVCSFSLRDSGLKLVRRDPIRAFDEDCSTQGLFRFA
jgi:hypothetical protein